MKNLLFIICCTAVHGAFAQTTAPESNPTTPLAIKEIPPLPVVEITAIAEPIEFWRSSEHRINRERNLLRKYDTSAELIFMSDSDVWMADPSARSR